jgi:hypothetical protein
MINGGDKIKFLPIPGVLSLNLEIVRGLENKEKVGKKTGYPIFSACQS